METSKKITGLYSDLEKELSGINESLSGRLCIGCALLRMSYNMPAILKAFISKYPNVELQLYENYTTKGLEDILLAGEIDLAIINKRDRPRVCYIPFFEEELLLAVPPTQTLALKGVERPGLLYPWIDIRLLHNQPRLFSFGDLVTKWELSIAYREGMLFSNTAIEFIYMVKNIYTDSGLG